VSERLEPQNDLPDYIDFPPDTAADCYAVESGLTALGGLKEVMDRTRLHSSDQETIDLHGKRMTGAGLTEAEQRIIMMMAVRQ
jgi:hypothetical protein